VDVCDRGELIVAMNVAAETFDRTSDNAALSGPYPILLRRRQPR
jgi:hypothetical protein